MWVFKNSTSQRHGIRGRVYNLSEVKYSIFVYLVPYVPNSDVFFCLVQINRLQKVAVTTKIQASNVVLICLLILQFKT